MQGGTESSEKFSENFLSFLEYNPLRDSFVSLVFLLKTHGVYFQGVFSLLASSPLKDLKNSDLAFFAEESGVMQSL